MKNAPAFIKQDYLENTKERTNHTKNNGNRNQYSRRFLFGPDQIKDEQGIQHGKQVRHDRVEYVSLQIHHCIAGADGQGSVQGNVRSNQTSDNGHA